MEHGNVAVGASKSNRFCILNHGKLMLRWLRWAIHQTNKQPGNEMFQPRHWWKCSECLFTSWKRKIMENRWSIFGNRREQNFKSKAELQEVRSAWSAWKCRRLLKHWSMEVQWSIWSMWGIVVFVVRHCGSEPDTCDICHRRWAATLKSCSELPRLDQGSHGFTWFHWVSDVALKSNWKVLKTKCCTQKWVDKWT